MVLNDGVTRTTILMPAKASSDYSRPESELKELNFIHNIRISVIPKAVANELHLELRFPEP